MKILLGVLSLPVFSRLYGWFTRRKRPKFIIKRVIGFFMEAYEINMADYQGKPEDYQSLAEFFIRPLNGEKRGLEPQEDFLLSPADGVLTSIETITVDEASQIKGKRYAVSELIGEVVDFSRGWHVAVIYLSPANYHRFHYPLGGRVKRYLHTGVRLFPVNSLGLNYIERLFIRNERYVLEMNSGGTSWYISAVGATFVGSIRMECVYNNPEKRERHKWHGVEQDVQQLAEMGRFNLGSTIVMVLPSSLAQPLEEKVGQPVRVGEPIFKLLNR